MGVAERERERKRRTALNPCGSFKLLSSFSDFGIKSLLVVRLFSYFELNWILKLLAVDDIYKRSETRREFAMFFNEHEHFG